MTETETAIAKVERLIAKAWRAMPDDLGEVDKVACFAGIALAQAHVEVQTACTAFASLTAKQAGRAVWVMMENPADGTRTAMWDQRLHGPPPEAAAMEVPPSGAGVH